MESAVVCHRRVLTPVSLTPVIILPWLSLDGLACNNLRNLPAFPGGRYRVGGDHVEKKAALRFDPLLRLEVDRHDAPALLVADSKLSSNDQT